MLVLLSAHEIYFLFRGLQKAQEEIELYISETITRYVISQKRYKNINQIFTDYINDWSHRCNTQTQNEYSTYRKLFICAFDTLIKVNTQESISILREHCEKNISCFLQADSVKIKARGIELLVDVYECVWKFVISPEFDKEETSEFNLFGEVDYTLDEALKAMSLQLIGKTFSWEHLTDIVARTTFVRTFDNSAIFF